MNCGGPTAPHNALQHIVCITIKNFGEIQSKFLWNQEESVKEGNKSVEQPSHIIDLFFIL